MGKFELLLSLKAYLEQLKKVFFEHVSDETPTSMEMNFLHKIVSTTNTSDLLWDWPTVKYMDILFCALSIIFMFQISQHLQMQAEEKLV